MQRMYGKRADMAHTKLLLTHVSMAVQRVANALPNAFPLKMQGLKVHLQYRTA